MSARRRDDDEDERGGLVAFMLRPILHNPKDAIAFLVAAAMIAAIAGNALFMQAGRHPSPMFGPAVSVPAAQTAVANLLPKSRPLEAEPQPVEFRPAESRSQPESKPVVERNSDPVGQLVARTTAPAQSASPPRPPAPVPVAAKSDPVANLIASQRRVAAIQRALTEFGYGQLKPTGNVGTETQAAITKFEKERKLPVTGQVSDRLVRELAVVTGRPIE